MKRTGVLDRSQRGRSFAEETLVGAGDTYVLFDERLLRSELANATVNRSMLIAFIPTVNLSPDPMPPTDATRRFGVTSPMTIRNLWREAVRSGAIEKAELANGKIMVGRRGYDGFAKNVVARNVLAKNVSTHNNRECNTGNENPSQPQENHYSDRARHDQEATPSMANEDDTEQEARTSPHLLSWAYPDEANSIVEQFLDGAYYCDIDEIAAMMPDSELRSAIETATDGRVHPVIVAPAGLYAVRILAACLLARGDPEDRLQPLQAVLAAIRRRIGDRPGQWLNSLELIGMRLAGQVSTGDWALADQFYRNANGGSSAPHKRQTRRTRPIPRLIADFFAVDHAGVLHNDLQSCRQHDVLRHRVREYGEELVEVTIKAELARHAIDGGEIGKVRTWSYFDGPLKDARHAVHMQESGIRPGDVFGWWRKTRPAKNDETGPPPVHGAAMEPD
jgi:hypothetical protein